VRQLANHDSRTVGDNQTIGDQAEIERIIGVTAADLGQVDGIVRDELGSPAAAADKAARAHGEVAARAAAETAAGEAAAGEAGEAGDAEELPSFSEQLAEQLGGVRGLVESSIPVTVFVVVNIVSTLRPALIASVGTAVAMAVFRLSRRQSVRHAVNGLFGILVGAAIAWRTGQAKDFYLPGIVLGLGYAVAMLASVAARRPLVGWIWSIVLGGGSTHWREEPRLLRTFSWLTVLWAGIYAVKVVIQTGLYLTNQVHALGVARLALGYPPYALLLAVTVWAVRRATHDGPAEAVEPAA
jgi:Protein of unknown function (DUF3159)